MLTNPLHRCGLVLSTTEENELPPPVLQESRRKPRQGANIDAHWRPFALRRYVLYGFCAVLGALVIALEVIFFVSNKNQGLADGISTNWLYLYTYGPAALFTLLAAGWACVEHEAKIIAPWIRAQEKREEAEHEWLLLDYVSMWSPLVPFRALRNRDFLVASSAIISALLTILIVISPSLIKQTPVSLKQPIEIQSQIIDDPSRLSRSSLLPIYAGIGLSRYGLNYPNGVVRLGRRHYSIAGPDDNEDIVVLQALSPSPDQTLEMQTVVEGFTTGLDCQSASMKSFDLDSVERGGDLDDRSGFDINFTVDLSAPGCNLSTSITTSFLTPDTNWMFGHLSSGQCAGMSPADAGNKRLVFILGEFTLHNLSLSNATLSNFTISNTTPIICKPSYSVGKYEVSQIAGHTKVTPLAERSQAMGLGNLRSWDLAQAMLGVLDVDEFENVIQTLRYEELKFFELGNADLDAYFIAIVGLYHTSFPTKLSLFNESAITSALQHYFQTHIAFLVHSFLFEPAVSTAPGYAKVQSDRLLVQALASQSMAILCVVVIVTLFWVLAIFPADVSLPGHPGIVMGVATLTERIASEFPRGLGSENSQTIEGVINSPKGLIQESGESEQESRKTNAAACNPHEDNPPTPRPPSQLPKLYHPLSLRPMSQISMCVLLVGLIIVLETLLRLSKSGEGIGEVPGYSYLHYLWTALPTGVLSLVGAVFSSIDSERRILAPFYALRRGPVSMGRSVNLNLLGLPAPQALYKQLKVANYVGALATTAAFLASFLTITSGSLFHETAHFNIPGRLRIEGSFTSTLNSSEYNLIFGVSSGNVTSELNDIIVSSLLLGSNLSYPVYTFEDLALPELVWDNSTTSAWSNTTGLETHAVVPALRSGVSCYRHPKSDIVAELAYFDPSVGEDAIYHYMWPAGERVRVNVTGEYCSDYSYFDSSSSAVFFLGEQRNETDIFGVTYSRNGNSVTNSCSNYFYVWGSFTRGPSPVVLASAMSCNASITAVDVELVLSGPEFAISEDHPPRPRKDTERIVVPGNDSDSWVYNVYQDLAPLPVTGRSLLDPFFSALVTSRHAIPISALADPTQESEVADAIIFQHNIIATQKLSMTSRVPFAADGAGRGDPGIFAWTGQGGVNETIPATIIGNPHGLSARVVQDPAATRVLEALLSTTLVFAFLGWAFGTNKGVLPRPPTYVASTLALLVDGDLLAFCHRGPDETTQPSTDMKSTFGNKRVLRLGLPGCRRNFGIWVTDESGAGEAAQTKGREGPIGGEE